MTLSYLTLSDNVKVNVKVLDNDLKFMHVVRYCVRVNPRFQLFWSVAVSFWYKWSLQYIDCSCQTKRSLDLLFSVQIILNCTNLWNTCISASDCVLELPQTGHLSLNVYFYAVSMFVSVVQQQAFWLTETGTDLFFVFKIFWYISLSHGIYYNILYSLR